VGVICFAIAVLTGATAVFTVVLGHVASAQTEPTIQPVPTPTEPVNCSTFATQPEAQTFFVAHGGSKANNFDNLDPNRNGIACEGLPGTPTLTSPTPAPTAAPAATTKPLPSNGIFSMILGMSGLSLVEAGIGLSLLSDRIKSRGGRIPLAVLKLLAKAARQGKREVALTNDVYIVRRQAGESHVRTTDPMLPPTPAVVSRLAPRVAILAPTADEWSAALALEEASGDDVDDWPYFTPPEV
jgi:hypothetical protein